MTYDGIIFDIDGTLWNTLPACTKGWNQALEKLGFKERVTQEQIASMMGTPQDEAVENLFPGLLLKHQNALNHFGEGEGSSIRNEGGKFYEGVLEGIKKLSQHTPIFLLSNCQSWYLELFLQLSELTNYLTDSDCYGHKEESKTQMLRGLQQKHDFKKGVYIGDTLRDQKAAKEAKFDFIFAAYGFGEVDGEGAGLSFEDSEELMRYLQQAVSGQQ